MSTWNLVRPPKDGRSPKPPFKGRHARVQQCDKLLSFSLSTTQQTSIVQWGCTRKHQSKLCFSCHQITKLTIRSLHPRFRSKVITQLLLQSSKSILWSFCLSHLFVLNFPMNLICASSLSNAHIPICFLNHLGLSDSSFQESRKKKRNPIVLKERASASERH